MIRTTLAATLALGLMASQAQARHHHHPRPHHHHRSHFVVGAPVRCDNRYPHTCDVRGWRENRKATPGETVAHPAGCPRVAFCGCGAAIEVFGRPIRALWLAANWLRFPRAEPAPGMAAVRQHHVMVIREYLGGGRALVYDANSGGHLTRVHVRSLAGYRIVNPRAS